MHPLYPQASSITHDIIGSAIEVHKDKGPGLLESIYEWCLTKELQLRDYSVHNQKSVVIRYKEFEREDPLKFDLLVNECLLVEVKSVTAVHPIHKARCATWPADQFQCRKTDRRRIETDTTRSESRLKILNRTEQRSA